MTIILTPSILLVVTASIIKDPVLFTKQFNPEGQRIAHPGHGEGMSIIGDTVGYAKSPLFPYSDIFDNRTVVTNCNPDYREIDVDTIWNIFFVRISSCSWPEQLNEAYYGPYKSTVKLTEL